MFGATIIAFSKLSYICLEDNMFYIIISIDMCSYSSSNPFSLFWSNGLFYMSQETLVGWVFLNNVNTSTHFGLIIILKWFYIYMLMKLSCNINIIRLGCTFPIKYGDWYSNICLFKDRPTVASWCGRLGNIAWMELTLDGNFIIKFFILYWSQLWSCQILMKGKTWWY